MTRNRGFTLIEILVVIIVLAVLMVIALPLYLRALRDSQRRTCRANMQAIAHAEQAYRVRSAGHAYTGNIQDLVGLTEDLQALPRCPADGSPDTDDYEIRLNGTSLPTVLCDSDDDEAAAAHNRTTRGDDQGYTPGADEE